MKVTIETSKWNISLQLFDEKAPKTVTNFAHLATTWYYDWLVFHRVIENFMIQWGCPDGTGMWWPWYTFEDEFDSELKHDWPWVLSMANAWPWTNGSQFFITHIETSRLDWKHTVFWKVLDEASQIIVNAIEQWDIIKKINFIDDTTTLFKDNEEFLTMIS